MCNVCVSHYYLKRVLIVGHTKEEEGRETVDVRSYYVLLGKANQFLVHDNNEHSSGVQYSIEERRVSFIVTTNYPLLLSLHKLLFIS